MYLNFVSLIKTFINDSFNFILGLYAFAFGTLAMSAPLPHYVDALQHMHIAAPLIFSLKFILAWSFFYHGVNGVRHLVCSSLFLYKFNNIFLIVDLTCETFKLRTSV